MVKNGFDQVKPGGLGDFYFPHDFKYKVRKEAPPTLILARTIAAICLEKPIFLKNCLMKNIL